MKALKSAKEAYKRALGTMKGAAGVKRDDDLSYYLKMTPDSLDALREHYGDEQVEKYIQDMEQKRRGQDGEDG